MAFNKNSNLYQIVYAAIMVVIVGVLLAGVYMALKPKQDDNRANDKRKQILAAILVPVSDDNAVGKSFEEYITDGYLIDREGNKIDKTELKTAFDIDMKKNLKAAKTDSTKLQLPVFEAKTKDGKKYIIPVYGAGLWGPIWGYVAVNDDGKTIYGAYFSHEGETPGLGAKIGDKEFQDEFKNKNLYNSDDRLALTVKKQVQIKDTTVEVAAISGATITSGGVGAMLQDCLTPYNMFFKKLQGGNTNSCQPEQCKQNNCQPGECKHACGDKCETNK